MNNLEKIEIINSRIEKLNSMLAGLESNKGLDVDIIRNEISNNDIKMNALNISSPIIGISDNIDLDIIDISKRIEALSIERDIIQSID